MFVGGIPSIKERSEGLSGFRLERRKRGQLWSIRKVLCFFLQLLVFYCRMACLYPLRTARNRDEWSCLDHLSGREKDWWQSLDNSPRGYDGTYSYLYDYAHFLTNASYNVIPHCEIRDLVKKKNLWISPSKKNIHLRGVWLCTAFESTSTVACENQR